MPTFQQRRDTILSQFAQAKADLETLNSDIDTEIEKNKSGKFSYISKFHIIISCKLIVYIVMCFYQETN